MGWMNRKSQNAKPPIPMIQVGGNTKTDFSPSVTFVEHVQDVNDHESAKPHISRDTLPHIDAATVIAAGGKGLLWIVIGDIVYDCTNFVHEHPGGTQVLESFRSSNCTWQFWRFHGKEDLEKFGKPLRIGRTEGIHNRFKEPPRFVGLRKSWGPEC